MIPLIKPIEVFQPLALDYRMHGGYIEYPAENGSIKVQLDQYDPYAAEEKAFQVLIQCAVERNLVIFSPDGPGPQANILGNMSNTYLKNNQKHRIWGGNRLKYIVDDNYADELEDFLIQKKLWTKYRDYLYRCEIPKTVYDYYTTTLGCTMVAGRTAFIFGIGKPNCFVMPQILDRSHQIVSYGLACLDIRETILGNI